MFTVGSGSGQEVNLPSQTLVRTSVWYHVAAVRGSNFTSLCERATGGQTNVSLRRITAPAALFRHLG